jgi:CP family cyanate transporter-like MFS transporter
MKRIALATLWFAGADLRLTVLAVPPVLPLIHHQFGLSERAIGALSGLPVLLFGLAAIPGSLLIARLGARRAAVAGLLVIAASSAARGLGPSVPMLFAMTFVMAAGVAFVQPALPALVGEWFISRAGFATAVYANGLLVGEALPAALTIPLVLPLVGGSWPASFAVWSVPVAVTALLMALCPTPPNPAQRATTPPAPATVVARLAQPADVGARPDARRHRRALFHCECAYPRLPERDQPAGAHHCRA